ncbi:hypothetical protein FB45DRAFT_928329 [Roridomyces roridus]|uniref:Uncharacterized protein n=1 Tax=Roridomyces roridus TaxID=1738132 RepID=A0AAD7BH83_9AGAR|nr:hypothetical protein FB45DRAFT_928329 [Roridomyces roridus]
MADSSDSDFSLSKLSLHSNGSQSEDWDRSMSQDDSQPPSPGSQTRTFATTTPRNSVLFPANHEDDNATPGRGQTAGKGKRSLSELLRLHSEKGTDCRFTVEETAQLADVLNDWINADTSPYEKGDDFFERGSRDDLDLPKSKSQLAASRPRGQSDSSNNSRPPSAASMVKS